MKYALAIYTAILVLLLSLMVHHARACEKTIIDNQTKEWNNQDQVILERALKRCKELFPDAPCLKRFIKRDSTTYRAVCGQ